MRKIVLQECGSTNIEAADREKYRHGDAVIAIRQTAGRGQRGRSWESAPGENLTFTVVTEPGFLPVAEQFLLSQATALAVADTLAAYGVGPSVKWTNDIYVGDRKICGMLIEHDLRGTHLARSIAGIGININQTAFPDFLPNPTSLARETGRSYDIMEVFDKFATSFEARYAMLEEGGADSIRTAYHDLLYRLDKPHRYMIPGRGEVTATLRGVGPAGQLIAEIDGQTETFLFKEIEFII